MKPERLYHRRFVIAATVYVILILVSVSLVKTMENNPLRLVVALLPIIPIVFAMGAFLAYLRRLDEMQRRIHFEAFGFSLGMTGIVTFTLGLMENAGFERPSLVWVFPMIIIFWVIGQYLARQRYE